MRFGTSLHALTEFGNDHKPFETALDEAAACGFDSLMILDFPGLPAVTDGSSPAGALIDLGASDTATVLAALGRRNLEVGGVYRACVNVSTEAEAEQTAAALGDLVALATRYGATIAIPNAGAAPAPGMALADKEPLIQRLAAAVSAALEEAPAELRTAIDVHYGGVLETVADCARFFELAPDPRAGIALNIGHMTTCRQEGWRLPVQFPERVPVVAWKDHLLTPPADYGHAVYSVELGTGDSPFERYVEVLAPDDGSRLHLITFENLPFDEKPAALARSLQHLKRLWAQA